VGSIKQFLIGAGICSLEAVISCTSPNEVLPSQNNSTFAQKMQEESNNSLSRFNEAMLGIMRAQEKMLGIVYKETPKIKMELPPGLDWMTLADFVASYNKETKTMYVHPSYKRCDVTPIITNPLHNDFKIIDDGWHEREYDLNYIKEILAHELGHHYAFELRSKLKCPDYLNPELPWLNIREHMGILIIREGIGTYFGELLKGEKAIKVRNKEDFEEFWSKKYTFEDIKSQWGNTYIIYEGGYEVVKPIIDRYKNDGLIYLLKNPLVIKKFDLSKVIDYQKKALEELESAKSKK
jgi:hypothetical protein